MTTIQIKVPTWLDRILVWPLLLYRRLRFGWPFRKIPLGESLFTIVDPDVYYLLNCFHWSARRNSNCIYAVRFLNCIGQKPKILSMHREIMNPRKGLLVDHKNRNTLDNRRDNLRIATHSQNQFNKAKTSEKTSSRFIGVYLEKSSRLWATKISHHGKSIWLGRFKSESEAARAYDAAAKKYHGEFARLNFTEDI
ncbi:MAG: AP2 domain-containing protein [Planctomycetota bacterium]